MIFDDIIGQEGAILVLKKAVESNNYSAAYLFSGPSGVGKTTIGRILSMTILCESPVNFNPCLKCESCQLFLKEQHFSYRELDAASYGGKEDMIKLRDDASSLGVTDKKIILIDESHDISKQGEDALLKQIEQCPEHLIYIFCTTDPDKMQDTLLNRCSPFHITKIKPSLIKQRLKIICEKEGLTYQDDALQIIAVRSEGHVRNAINLLELVAYLGEISIGNLDKISKDFEEDIFTIVSNIGIDLKKVIDTYRKISSYLSVFEFYNLLLSMVNDAVKLIHGYENFIEKRKKLLMKLKRIHGHSLAEFLNYLVTRDKFVEKVGIESDLLILHYKYSANSFIPRIQKEPLKDPQKKSTKKNDEPSTPSLTIDELTKMKAEDRSKILRDQRKKHKLEEKEESPKVPLGWPLPKEESPGESSTREGGLTPLEFSHRLVGGRSGERKQMANSRTK